MLVIITLMFTGVLVGYLLRKRPLQHINSFITILIWALLFLLGLEVGSNPSIMSSLPTLGVDALILSVAAVTGSAFTAWLLWKSLHKTSPSKDNSQN